MRTAGSFLALAVASFQTIVAMPQVETQNASHDNIQLVVDGVIQDEIAVTTPYTSHSPFSAWLWDDHCNGSPGFTWQASVDGECFTFVNSKGDRIDMYSVRVDPSHCTSFVYHDNYGCRGNGFHGPGDPDTGCNSFSINSPGVSSKVTSIKSFQVRCY